MYLKQHLKITLDGLTFTSKGQGSGAQRFILDPDAIQGWYDGPPTRRNTTSRALSSGDFYEPSRWSSRVITISGTAVADSADDLATMRDDFAGLLGSEAYKPLVVTDGSGSRQASVTRDGTPSWKVQGDTVASWQMALYAPDPRIYSAVEHEVTLSGQAISGGLSYPLSYPLYFSAPEGFENTFIRNDGNTDSWPTFMVQGDYYGGFTLSDSKGHTVEYTGDVTMSSPVYVNFRDGSVVQNNVDKSYNLSQRGWFPLRPGVPLEPSFTPNQSGNGWCTIFFHHTWI